MCHAVPWDHRARPVGGRLNYRTVEEVAAPIQAMPPVMMSREAPPLSKVAFPWLGGEWDAFRDRRPNMLHMLEIQTAARVKPYMQVVPPGHRTLPK